MATVSRHLRPVAPGETLQQCATRTCQKAQRLRGGSGGEMRDEREEEENDEEDEEEAEADEEGITPSVDSLATSFGGGGPRAGQIPPGICVRQESAWRHDQSAKPPPTRVTRAYRGCRVRAERSCRVNHWRFTPSLP
ncbi:unnamed protein product, partial [Prorocentrum cordatum]